jgi:hypothetical protein
VIGNNRFVFSKTKAHKTIDELTEPLRSMLIEMAPGTAYAIDILVGMFVSDETNWYLPGLKNKAWRGGFTHLIESCYNKETGAACPDGVSSKALFDACAGTSEYVACDLVEVH